MATSKRGLNVLVQVCSIIAAFALTNIAASADNQYPSKAVRIVVSFAAGGPTDTVARVIGAKLGDMFGQQFFVENRTGAGGNIGADMAAKSPPDGYTLLMATVSTHAINPGLYARCRTIRCAISPRWRRSA
jgi:tripartite-type tricarboxylate transporter receptor subunit TctC